MVPATRFTDPASVETWDACFRWRAGDALRDVTIDDTWWRIAQAVAAPEGTLAPLWAHRYVDAFSRWRLLPDERLLRCLGTDIVPEASGPPAAVLNVAAFVNAPIGATPRFDRGAFVDTAALAVRMLDDATMVAGYVAGDGGLRIGVIGLGDALRKLGVPYSTPSAQEAARTMAIALAEGCLRGAVDLAEERGPFASGAASPGLMARWQEQGLPPGLIDSALRCGVRHAQLTAVERHPLLARLANGASDALDSLPVPPHASSESGAMLVAAEREIRAAMQPWIDQSIDGMAGAVAALVRVSSNGLAEALRR